MIKPTIKYAILCGVFLIGLFFISIKFGSNPLLESRHFWFDLGVCFLFSFFAAKEYKDFRNKGILHFWQGMSIGFIVLIPAVVIFFLFLVVIFQTNPELMDEYYRAGAKMMVDAKKDFLTENFGSESIAEQYQLIENRTSIDVILRNSFWKLLTGCLITPVVAIILRKKPK